MPNHKFPPTIWQYQDWSISGLNAFFAFCLVVAVICVIKARSSMPGSLLWPLAVALFGLILFQQWGAKLDGARRINLLDLWLNGLIVLVAIAGIVRSWTLTVDRFAPYEGIAVAVIVLLVFGLMMPSTCTPRQVATRTQCKNNLKQIALAMHNYHDANSMFPPVVQGQPEQSWRVTLLPLLDHQSMYDRYDVMSAWDSDVNLAMSRELVRAFNCPQRPDRRNRNASGQFLTSYIAPTGPDTVLAGGSEATIRSITDGTSNTLMILEACGSKIVWSEPRDIPMTSQSTSVNAASTEVDYSESLFSSYHTGGAQVLLSDGSVRFLGENTDTEILKGLLTKSGGEPLKEW